MLSESLLSKEIPPLDDTVIPPAVVVDIANDTPAPFINNVPEVELLSPSTTFPPEVTCTPAERGALTHLLLQMRKQQLLKQIPLLVVFSFLLVLSRLILIDLKYAVFVSNLNKFLLYYNQILLNVAFFATLII